MKRLILLLLLGASTAWSAETQRVHLWPVPGSVASGVHVLFMGRKMMEQQFQVPGAADLTAYVLEQAYREMEDEFDALGCELQFADLAFIPFDDYYTRDDMAFIRLRVPAGKEPGAVRLLGTLIEKARRADTEAIDRAVRGCAMANRMRRSTGQTAAAGLRNWLFTDTELTLPNYMSDPPADMDVYRKFLSAFLAPDNMLVTIAGNTGGEVIQEALTAAFGTGTVQLPDLVRVPVMDSGEPVVNISAPGGQGYLLMVSPLPELKTDRERAAAVLWASRISNRIAFQLREKEGLAYSIGAAISDMGGREYLSIHMGTGPETVAAAAKRIPEMIDMLRTEAVDEDELTRLKNSVLISRRMRRLMKSTRPSSWGWISFMVWRRDRMSGLTQHWLALPGWT